MQYFISLSCKFPYYPDNFTMYKQIFYLTITSNFLLL